MIRHFESLGKRKNHRPDWHGSSSGPQLYAVDQCQHMFKCSRGERNNWQQRCTKRGWDREREEKKIWIQKYEPRAPKLSLRRTHKIDFPDNEEFGTEWEKKPENRVEIFFSATMRVLAWKVCTLCARFFKIMRKNGSSMRASVHEKHAKDEENSSF